MKIFLRVVRLLAMVVWVGGIVFFAFVVAPTAFGVLPSKHEAGTVVAGTLNVLNRMGDVAAFLFAATTAGLYTSDKRANRLFTAEMVLVLGMISATAMVQWKVVPAMERDRIAAGGDVDAAAPTDPARVDFERLHPISEKVEGAVLFLGLGVVVLMGLEKLPSAAQVASDAIPE
jgi:uncharacterized membrane protein